MLVNLYNYIHRQQIINTYQDTFQDIYNLINKYLKIKRPKSVDVNFVSKHEIKKINNKYRNKNKVTDVISFAFDESCASQIILGELYICYKQAKKQAKKYQHSLKREICFLFTHGILHLYGYDHLSKKQETIMFNLQEKILKECKIYRN